MNYRLLSILICLIFLPCKINSQDYFGYGGSNYCSLNQVYSNPASIADGKLKLEVLLTGYDVTMNNSWFGINKSALRYTGSIFHPKSISWPTSWKNLTPNVPNNVFKNFNFVNSGKEVELYFESRFIYPSAMVQINKDNSVAFSRSVRKMGNVDGISGQLAYLFEQELNLNVTQNNRVQNQLFNAIEMTWAEYGFTYARVLYNKQKHFLKAGITPKLLYGIESTYLQVRDLDFLLSSKDTLSYFNASVSYAHSGGDQGPTEMKPPMREFNHFVTGPALGLDFGFIYEWRPYTNLKKVSTSGKGIFKNTEASTYKIKFGASIVDVGKIKFKKEGTRYDLDLAITNKDITTFISLENFAMLDSLLRADFGNSKEDDYYSIQLPTAINAQLDIAFLRGLFLNVSAHFANLNKNNSFRIHNYSAICLAPRIEHFWFDVSLPISYNVLSAKRGEYVSLGLAVRIGPLSFGTNNVIQSFGTDLRAVNYYALLRFFIPQKDKKGKIEK